MSGAETTIQVIDGPPTTITGQVDQKWPSWLPLALVLAAGVALWYFSAGEADRDGRRPFGGGGGA